MKIGFQATVETVCTDLCELISTVQIHEGNRQPHIRQQDP